MSAKKKSKKSSSRSPRRTKGNTFGFGKPSWNPFVVILIVLAGWSLLSFIFQPASSTTEQIPISNVFERIRQEEVDKITIDGDTINLTLKSGETVTSSKEPQISFYELMHLEGLSAGMVPDGIQEEKSLPWIEILSNLAFPVITLIFLWWIFRQAGRSTGGLFSIGKSKAKLFSKNEANKIGFDDVAGANEVKSELVEVVDFLKNASKYRKLGARIPKGILLIGPSGVGKTLLARAVAGEAGVPFYSVAGSEFIEMIVGVGSARVRDLFNMAKQTSPSLIFIDEIDAIGRHRGRAAAVSNDEREQTLNQILVEMDGFDPRTNVIILAATNRPDMLDPALIRPGRFDRHIRIDLPNVTEREGIIKIHMKGKPFDDSVNVERLARQTVGFSGADIENMLNEAAILAARRNSEKIESRDLTEASTKVKLGPERRLLQTDEEKKMIAYHEAGHALVSTKNPDAEPVTRISIISRSMSLGHTQILPRDTVYNQTRANLLAMILSMLGGRAAEELIYKQETVGASNDIERATYLAHKMVTEFGMSDLGPINFTPENAAMWDARAPEKAIGYSQKVAEQIDAQVSRIISGEYQNALRILTANRNILDDIADELLKSETLEQDEFEAIIEKHEKA